MTAPMYPPLDYLSHTCVLPLRNKETTHTHAHNAYLYFLEMNIGSRATEAPLSLSPFS